MIGLSTGDGNGGRHLFKGQEFLQFFFYSKSKIFLQFFLDQALVQFVGPLIVTILDFM